MNLSIELLNKDHEYVLQLNGEIDVYTAPKLKKQLLPLVEQDDRKIQIDLLHTTYIDSTGLGVFIQAYKEAQENNCELELVHVHDRVLRLFQVTGLDRIMNIHESKIKGERVDE